MDRKLSPESWSEPVGPFRAHPLLRSGHLQTVLGALVNRDLPNNNAVHHSIPLPDGEGLVVHEEQSTCVRPDSPIAILVHGLGGDHSSPYLRRMAHRMSGLGIRVWRMDLRGCGAGLSAAYMPAHAGSSQDLAEAASAAMKMYPQAHVSIAAFSLGGNILLKMLGEAASGIAPDNLDLARLKLAVAVAPPSDLHSCATNMERLSRLPYTRYYLRMLDKQVAIRSAHWEQWRKIHAPSRPKTIRQFDTIYTAPLAGFASTDEYYTRSSSADWLQRITVPTRLLIDRDDPIIPSKTLEKTPTSQAITKTITRFGGHLGYLARNPRGGGLLRWMDHWVIDQIQRSSPS